MQAFCWKKASQKLQPLKTCEGRKLLPIGVTLVDSKTVLTDKWPGPKRNNYCDRLYIYFQV